MIGPYQLGTRSIRATDNYPTRRTLEALDVLKGEHSALLSEVHLMDRQLAFLESSGPIKGARVLKELVETSRKMQGDLRQHTSKEEKNFFPVLESRLGNDRELVGVMKREHEELIRALESLTAELNRMTKDHDTRKTWNLVSKLQDLKGELADHLSREERVLFWLAELRLSRLDQRKIASGLQSSTGSHGPLQA
jgi:hemerythrin-like domain-containing protein